jgi:hypothetical protein
MKIAAVVVAATLMPLAAATARAQEAPRYFFEGDLVRGGGPAAQGPVCVLNSQFKRKETVVWRVRVLDAKTGKPVDASSLKILTVELPNGEKVAMKLGQHPPRGEGTDMFWSGSWIIPENHPTGSLSYKVVATDNEGKSVSWRPFNVVASELTVVAN